MRRGAARGEACAALEAFDPNRPPSGSVASAGTALVGVCGPGDGSGSRRVQNPCGAAPLGRDAARVSRWARPTLYGATRKPNRRPRCGSPRTAGPLRRGPDGPNAPRGSSAGSRRWATPQQPVQTARRGTTHQQREGPHHRCCRTGPQGAETPEPPRQYRDCVTCTARLCRVLVARCDPPNAASGLRRAPRRCHIYVRSTTCSRQKDVNHRDPPKAVSDRGARGAGGGCGTTGAPSESVTVASA